MICGNFVSLQLNAGLNSYLEWGIPEKVCYLFSPRQ